jgi:predicted metal-dependent phosphoesterase TrpH
MRFEIHCHSTHSDGKNTPLEIVEYARKTLDGIIITDHDRLGGAIEALSYATEEFRVLAGMEVSSSDGHILAYEIMNIIPRDLPAKETVELIHSQGGLAVAAHPYDLRRRGVGDLIHKVDFDAVEVVNGHTFGNKKDPRQECEGVGMPMVGGTDAHTVDEIGSVTIEFDGDLRQAIKNGETVIHSRPLPELLLRHGIGLVKRKLL